jgi:hypothetical protein
MTVSQIFNSVDRDIINLCLTEYNNFGAYDTETMKKASPNNSISLLKPVIEKELGVDLIYCSGNYYKHSAPYLPHTDYKTYQDNTINVVIPLSYTGDFPYLVIFDQVWDLDSVTWCMHHPVLRFETNIGVKGCPHEYPIRHSTNHPIDNFLYETYLNHYPKECLYGLSGTAYPFEPGSLIIFNNKKIHCTGKMKGEKTGLSLRFKIL